MQLSITIDLGEGAFTCKPSLFAVVEWERKFKAKVGNSPFGLEDLMYLAFTQLKAEKEITLPPSFDDFCRKVVSIEADGGDDDPRPTETATDTL